MFKREKKQIMCRPCLSLNSNKPTKNKTLEIMGNLQKYRLDIGSPYQLAVHAKVFSGEIIQCQRYILNYSSKTKTQKIRGVVDK